MYSTRDSRQSFKPAVNVGPPRTRSVLRGRDHTKRDPGLDLLDTRKGEPVVARLTVIIGIGQGYWTATILQLAKATALLATRGQHFRPRLVRALVDPATGAVEERKPEPLPPVELNNRANWETIVDAMVAVTSGARCTAVRASRGAAYSIAGKTGTAQVYSVGQTEKYDEKTVAERLRDHALFVAFAPADKPALAIAVLVENGGHGSSVAAPIARAIFDAYLAEKPK